MRIGIFKQPYPQGNYLLNTYIASKLQEQGYEVALLNQISGNSEEHPAIPHYIDQIKQLNLDLLYYEMLDISTFKVVEALDCPKILCYASKGILPRHDSIVTRKKWYTYLWSNSRKFVRFASKIGVNTSHWQFYPGAHKLYQAKENTNYKVPCAFLGQGFSRETGAEYKLERELYFDNHEIPRDIWGKGWNHANHRGLLPAEDIGSLYLNAEHAFALINKSQRDMGQINNRYVEIAQSGCPTISINYPDIDWFGAERYIRFVSNRSEMKDAIIRPKGQEEIEYSLFMANKEVEFFAGLNEIIECKI